MPATFNYTNISRSAEDALREGFPGAAVSVAEGWQGRVHVKVVSSQFDGLSEEQKQGLVWDVLRKRLGPDAQGVSLALVFGMDEI